MSGYIRQDQIDRVRDLLHASWESVRDSGGDPAAEFLAEAVKTLTEAISDKALVLLPPMGMQAYIMDRKINGAGERYDGCEGRGTMDVTIRFFANSPSELQWLSNQAAKTSDERLRVSLVVAPDETRRYFMTSKLTPPDLEQCQAEKPNGNTFMTLGGSPGLVRCENKADFIAVEKEKGKDGQRGSMSLCTKCRLVFVKQMGRGFADFKRLSKM
jgi:hypothetical protein